MQFINIVVHSVEDMNFRVHLQYEFTKLGLEEFLQVNWLGSWKGSLKGENQLRHSTKGLSPLTWGRGCFANVCLPNEAALSGPARHWEQLEDTGYMLLEVVMKQRCFLRPTLTPCYSVFP